MSTLQGKRFCLSRNLHGSQPYVVNLAVEKEWKTQQYALYLTYDKFCGCLLCTLRVAKGAAVCCVPCMWHSAAVCCVPWMWQKVQLSVKCLACDKMCSCLLCTLHVTKGACCLLFNLHVTKGATVCCVPCMWQKMQLSVVHGKMLKVQLSVVFVSFMSQTMNLSVMYHSC